LPVSGPEGAGRQRLRIKASRHFIELILREFVLWLNGCFGGFVGF
jgi:hypothetical protein